MEKDEVKAEKKRKPSELGKKIGQRISDSMVRMQMSQKELAERLGYKRESANIISDYLAGVRIPRAEQIIEIARILDVPTGYLLLDDVLPWKDPDVELIYEYTGLSSGAAGFLHEMVEEARSDSGWKERNILRVVNQLLDGSESLENREFWSRLQAFMFADGGDFSLTLDPDRFPISRDDLLVTLLMLNNAYLMKLKEGIQEGQ